MEQLREIGWPSITPAVDERRGAMVCVPSRASGQLSQELMKRNIVTSNRDDNLRVCLHFYNNDEDVDVLVAALRELRARVRSRLNERNEPWPTAILRCSPISPRASSAAAFASSISPCRWSRRRRRSSCRRSSRRPSRSRWRRSRKYDERGPAWYWNNIACGEHTGTHFDAPIHWVTGKDYPNNATHNIPVQKFIGPACVIDVSDRVRENADFLVTVEVVQGVGAASMARSRAARGC